jgi:hypothetical protein
MRKWFRPRIGPGLIIALSLAAFLIWQRRQPPQVKRPVIIQHEGAIAATGVPDPGFVLERSQKLGLSASQRERVGQLATRYAKETESLRASLNEAADEAQGKLRGLSGKPASTTDVQAAAQSVAELSGLLAQARADAWPGLQKILTPAQQQQARQGWATAHSLTSASSRTRDRGGG